MGTSPSAISEPTMTFECRLVVDNDGSFAGLAPSILTEFVDSRNKALEFAKDLVKRLDNKNYNEDDIELKVQQPPKGKADIGLHCSTHNESWNKSTLTEEQIQMIRNCDETFKLTVDLRDCKILVGSPSNDESTGVIGYVGLIPTKESLDEYNRAVAVYGGIVSMFIASCSSLVGVLDIFPRP